MTRVKREFAKLLEATDEIALRAAAEATWEADCATLQQRANELGVLEEHGLTWVCNIAC
jgi:hypothetical protein